MRSDRNYKKKEGSAIGFFAKFLFVIALMVFLFLGGFFLWVFYGEDGDGKAEKPQTEEPAQQEPESVVIDVSKNWSVPAEAFKGNNGYGKFVPGKVKNKIDLDKIFSEMGIDKKTKDAGEKNRMDTVKRFVDGLYYEADKNEELSNGDTISVYIRSTEEPEEIESDANVIINGIGEHKKVTVSGLFEKFTYNELMNRQDLLSAAAETAKSIVKKADEGNYSKIFADEDRYEAELSVYGIYFAQPRDRNSDDHLVVIMRVKSTYPDSNYIYWKKDGDLVFTYPMLCYYNINKETTPEDIRKGMKYDAFRYQDKASEAFQWYRDNLDQDTTYTLQQMSYRE